MSVPSLASVRSIHILGIGGPGMSALARVLKEMGHDVTGCDIRNSPVIDELRQSGIDVSLGHDESHLAGADIVCHPTGFPEDNVELRGAGRAGIAVVHRSLLLAAVCAAARSVGIAGTHGKTSTSTLLVHILARAGIRSSWLIGAHPLGGLSASHWDASPSEDLFVVEADESDGTHDALPLWGSILTNIDIDHLDHHGTFDALVRSFSGYLGRLSGPVVVNGDDQNISLATEGLPADVGARLVRYGFAATNDVRVGELSTGARGILFTVEHAGGKVDVDLPMDGVHNALNCTAAMTMANELGVPFEVSAAAVGDYSGVERRLEHKGHLFGAAILDDYAHVPAEIEATLSAVRARHPDSRVVAVFQPNRYHRIATMHAEYADCFAAADTVVITDVYASGTAPIAGVTGELVVRAVRSRHPDVIWAPTRRDVVDAVLPLLGDSSVVVGMGCGDIATLSDDLHDGSERGGKPTGVSSDPVEESDVPAVRPTDGA